MLSEKAKKEYVKAHGVKCPYCGSYNIEGSGFHCGLNNDEAYENVKCLSCHKEWQDHYKLVSIVESE